MRCFWPTNKYCNNFIYACPAGVEPVHAINLLIDLYKMISLLECHEFICAILEGNRVVCMPC